MVKLHGWLDRADENSCVYDVVGDASCRQKLSLVQPRLTIGLILHKFHSMSVRIGDGEVVVPGPALADLVGHVDSVGGQVVSHLRCVIYINGNMVQAAKLKPLGLFRKQLQVLLIIDLDKGNTFGAVRPLQREGLFVSQEVLVERPRHTQVAYIEGDVGYPQNSRPFHLTRLHRRRKRNQGNESGDNKPAKYCHGVMGGIARASSKVTSFLVR